MEVNSKGPTTCYGAQSWEGISVGAVEAGFLEEVSYKDSRRDHVGKDTEWCRQTASFGRCQRDTVGK